MFILPACHFSACLLTQVILVNIRSCTKLSFPLGGLAGGISGETLYPFHHHRNFRKCDFPSMQLWFCDSNVHTEEMSPSPRIYLNLHVFAEIINNVWTCSCLPSVPCARTSSLQTSFNKNESVVENIQRATSCG